MSSERPEAEENFGLFLSPGGAAGQGGYLVPMHPLKVGPGDPGPGDEWHVPSAEEAPASDAPEPGSGPDKPVPAGPNR
jgi:hypothetical protein